MTHPHGMLFVATNVAAENEADFNQWYDHEHVAERVAIDGFLSGTRYQALDAERKYLGLYETRSLETFTSADYYAAFTRQTPWSVKNLERMIKPMRRVCAITQQHGQGSGSHLAVLTLQAGIETATLNAWQQQVATVPGYIASRLLTPDTTLSTPLPQEDRGQRAMQPMLLLSCSCADACQTLAAAAAQALNARAEFYALSWQLTKQEMAHGEY